MDIVKPKKSKMLSPKLIKFIVLGISFALFVSYASYQSALVTLDKKDLLIATVKKGNLDIIIQSYGKLVSEKVVAITTTSRATVNEIVFKPGAFVTQGQVLVKLSNPELNQQLESARQELTLAQASLRQVKLNQQRELLNEQAVLAQITSAYEASVLKRKAESKLVKQGIVSQITYQESQLNEKQLKKRVELLDERLKQLQLVHQEAALIEQEKIKQKKGQLRIAEKRVADLEVKSTINGVLQRLPISLGQSLSAGEEVAVIGSKQELIALVRVSQSQAQNLVIGQVAQVDSRQGIIQGEVQRIDPIVSDNTVEVEISFDKALPDSARPEQNVNAEIIANTLINVNYIERPSNLKGTGSMSLFRLDTQRSSARRVNVALGESNGRFIEVREGLEVGDEVIISDLNNYRVETIGLN